MRTLFAALLLVFAATTVRAQDPLFLNAELLHHPTTDGAVLSLLPRVPMQVSVTYGAEGEAPLATPTLPGRPGALLTIPLRGLPSSTACTYQVHVAGEPPRKIHRFRTLPEKGDTFSFAVAGDSHAYAVWAKAVCAGSPPPYELMLDTFDRIAARDDLSFLLLGTDHAMLKCGSCPPCEVEGVPISNKTVSTPGEAMLRYRQAFSPELVGRVASDLPMLVVLGDHEGEQGWLGNGIPAWGLAARRAHLPNPARIYGGPSFGNAFAVEAGDLLLVVVDVHRHAEVQPFGPDDFTLGARQLDWLERTLASSDHAFKIVVAEHLVGGLIDPDGGTSKGRGGITATDDGTPRGTFLGEQAHIQELLEAHGAQLFLSFQDHVVAFGEKLDAEGEGTGVHYLIGGRSSGVSPPAAAEPWYREAMDYDGDGVPEFDSDVTGTTSVGWFEVTVEGPERMRLDYHRTPNGPFVPGGLLLSFTIDGPSAPAAVAPVDVTASGRPARPGTRR